MLTTVAASDHAGHGIELRADDQPGDHEAKTGFQRGEIAAAVREPPRLPRGERVNQAEQRSQNARLRLSPNPNRSRMKK